MVSPQAQEIARLKAETRKITKQRYRKPISLLLAGAGLAADFAGLPLEFSIALWGMGLATWFILKAV